MNKLLSISNIAITFIGIYLGYLYYSTKNYTGFNESSFIVPFLVLLFTMQTKLGAKINILVERAIDLYEGRVNLKKNEKDSDYKKTQPISQAPSHQVSQADLLPNQQPNINNRTQTHHNNEAHNQQPRTDFNNMFAGPNNMAFDNEPVAANGALGGIFGGSAF